MNEVDIRKQAVRERVWELVERHQAVAAGVHGHIPTFFGAERAAERLAGRGAWRKARVVKSNPDAARLPVRTRALTEGRLAYMAVPRLATPEPFYRLDPATLTAPIAQVATGDGAAGAAQTIGVDQMRPVDLAVCGSVAVDRSGVRVGKGAGCSDIEMELLAEAGLIGPATVIVTTVHSRQVLDQALPETEHDVSVDVIVTPDDVIFCPPRRRPIGILPQHLSIEQASAIPALRGQSGAV